MRAYHVTKTREELESIRRGNTLLPGKNTGDENYYVHLSLKPFKQGSWVLNKIGPDMSEAWILEVEIPDNTLLFPDPSLYEKSNWMKDCPWVIHEGELSVVIVNIEYIENIPDWETGKEKYQAKRIL